MKKNLYINDINIGDYGIYISSDSYLNAPLIDYTEFQAPARDGNLILDNKRLNNVIRKFDCYIPDSYNLETGLNSLKKLIYSLRGYLKIVSDYDPDVYQYGYFAEELNVEPFTTKSAQFSLYFSCLPQKWFIDNDAINIGGTDTPTYSIKYLSNNDPIVQKILSIAKNNYNSPNGWIYGVDSARTLAKNTTYNFSIASDVNDKYIVCSHYDDDEFRIIAEVENKKLDTEYATGSTHNSYYVAYLIPVDIANIDITTNWVGISGDGIGNQGDATINRNYIDINNAAFENDEAFGFTPTIIFQKPINYNDTTGEGVVDVFHMNNKTYMLDYIKLLNDYNATEILNNFATPVGSYKTLYIMIDYYNCKAYIVNDYDFDADILLDISNCLIGDYKVEFGDTLHMKYGCLRPLGNLFIQNSLTRSKIKMGWWKL